MSRLLKANFARLIKSRIFWIGMAFSIGMGLLATTTQYREMLSIDGYYPHIDNILYSNGIFMPVVAAVFVGLFTGTEYSDGTIRNKLMIGHTRTAIYTASLIVCTVALVLIHLAYIAVVAGVGIPLVGNIEADVGALVMLGLLSLATVIALSALFLMMSILISSKANGAAASIIVSIVLLMAAMMIQNRLQQPEYYEAYSVSYTADTGETHEDSVVREKNPHYLEGTKRKVYECLYDFLPGCQMVQISAQNPAHPERLPLYSLSIIIVTCTCGVLCFGRKNIK